MQNQTTDSEMSTQPVPTTILWSASSPSPVLGDSDLHIWRVDLDLQIPRIPGLQPLLSPDEVERAARFLFQRDRNRFTIARAVLRILLGLYTDVSPAHLRFLYGPYGKPSLAGELRHVPVRFNVSHSRGIALYAITREREVGVDVEVIGTDFGWRTVAGQLLSPGEIASISALPPEEQVRMFFTCWARKEALAKALGGGLALPLRQVEITGGLHGSPILVSADEITRNADAWQVQDLDAGLNLAAAVAIADGKTIIHRWGLETDLLF